MTEIVFIVEESQDGGYFAKAVGEGIITQAESLPELREMIKDAVKCHFDNPADVPKIAHLHVTRDEVFAL